MRKVAATALAGILLSTAIAQVPTSQLLPTTEGDASLASREPTGPHQLTAADVEAFLEGILPQQLEREDIAGAVVSVVKDGKLLFAKGYGYANVADKKPVLPAETLFRPGSISKLFTWTAVMQQYEQGKLELDRDVNDYLDFKIPEAFGKPITLKNILTHTPGFEEQIKDLFTDDPSTPDLGNYCKTHIPRRIFPPGEVPAYSNYATALAGYIVQRVSGQPFSEYVDANIFKPLKMTRSTFVQPLPAELAPLMSGGYRLGSDDAQPFETVMAFPAGSLSSPAEDMARFMLAHLNDGELDGARILKPETAKLMHSRLFALDEAALGMAHGFYEESANGRRIIGHGGDTTLFHSDLHLVPEAGLGFYVSYNSGGRGEISPRTILWEAFLDRYLPDARPEMPTLETAKQDAGTVAGTYLSSRRPEGSFLRAFGILGEATVSPNEDGTISVEALTDPNGKPKRWREVAPMRFQDVNGPHSLIFKPDASGVMQVILPYPFMIFTRVGLWGNSKVLLPVLIFSLAVMLLTLILWPITWFVRRQYGYKLDLGGREGWLRIAVRVVFALNIVFVAGLMVLLMAVSMGNLGLLGSAGVKWIYLIQAIGVLGAIGTLLVIFHAVRAWMGSHYRIWGKLQSTVFVLACLGFLWFVFAGNLLKFTSTF